MFFFSLSLSCSRSFSQIHHNFGIHTRNWNTRCAQLHALNFWWVHRFVYFKLYTVYTCVCMFVCVCVCNVWCGRNGSSINQSSNFSPYTFIWYTYRIRLCNELSSVWRESIKQNDSFNFGFEFSDLFSFSLSLCMWECAIIFDLSHLNETDSFRFDRVTGNLQANQYQFQ